jgi:hypothetical protein
MNLAGSLRIDYRGVRMMKTVQDWEEVSAISYLIFERS